MAEYRLTGDDTHVIHSRVVGINQTPTEVWIPNDPANYDWIKYQEWLAAGGVPDPHVPPPQPEPETATVVLFDHENRLRTLEGQPVLTLQEFEQRTKK